MNFAVRLVSVSAAFDLSDFEIYPAEVVVHFLSVREVLKKVR